MKKSPLKNYTSRNIINKVQEDSHEGPYHSGLDSRRIKMATPVDCFTELRRYKSREIVRAALNFLQRLQ
jgi:hypothetical protein